MGAGGAPSKGKEKEAFDGAGGWCIAAICCYKRRLVSRFFLSMIYRSVNFRVEVLGLNTWRWTILPRSRRGLSFVGQISGPTSKRSTIAKSRSTNCWKRTAVRLRLRHVSSAQATPEMCLRINRTENRTEFSRMGPADYFGLNRS